MTQNFFPGGIGDGTQEFLYARKCLTGYAPTPHTQEVVIEETQQAYSHYSVLSLIPQESLRNGRKHSISSSLDDKEWTGRRGGRNDANDDGEDYRGGDDDGDDG